MSTDEDDKPPQDAKPPVKPSTTDRLKRAADLATQDAAYRKRLAGSSGPASGVRRIDPNDYVPAPSSKPATTPKHRKPK